MISSEVLQMRDGTAVETPEQWQNQRRLELLQLLQSEVFGVTPFGRPANLGFDVREEKLDARDGKATRLRVGILFEGTDEGRQMELLVYLPNSVEGPIPLFVGLNFEANFVTTTETDLPLPRHYVSGRHAGVRDHRATEAMRGRGADMWPYDEILARGYGIATACYGEVEPDTTNQWWHGPRVFAPPTEPNGWGAIGVWAWALSRALDYLQTHPRIDSKRVAAFGFSRLGKTAMWAGAQDERFAAVISQNSGKAGVSLLKRPHGEPVSHLTGPLGHWFAPRFAHYANNEAELPVDGDGLAALVAPRPLLVLSASEDLWSDPEGEFLSVRNATRVYNLLGEEGIRADQWPAPGAFINSRAGYFLRVGPHDVTDEDWAITLDWADKFLKP
ncbi:acetylxylan esterase [bacterium]|nr:MAG: acetylxylan esterase [bacterium]